MQYSVGTATHGHVQGEGIVNRLRRDNVQRLEVLFYECHHLASGGTCQLFAAGINGQDAAVAGQGHA